MGGGEIEGVSARRGQSGSDGDPVLFLHDLIAVVGSAVQGSSTDAIS